jgi:hypothetical protein
MERVYRQERKRHTPPGRKALLDLWLSVEDGIRTRSGCDTTRHFQCRVFSLSVTSLRGSISVSDRDAPPVGAQAYRVAIGSITSAFSPLRRHPPKPAARPRPLNQQSPSGWISGTFSGGVERGQTDAIPALCPPFRGGLPEGLGGGQRANCASSIGGDGPWGEAGHDAVPWHARGRNRLALRTQANTWNSV